VQFLMIGPAWLMHFIYKKIGIGYWFDSVQRLIIS
jgi:hypothetical protein